MGEGLKLYDQKPREGQPKPKNYTIPPTSPAPPNPSPMASAKTPVTPPKESFTRRYKFVWPVLFWLSIFVLEVTFRMLHVLVVIITAYVHLLRYIQLHAGYLFLRAKKKDTVTEDEEAPEKAVLPPAGSMSPPITDETLAIPKVN